MTDIYFSGNQVKFSPVKPSTKTIFDNPIQMGPISDVGIYGKILNNEQFLGTTGHNTNTNTLSDAIDLDKILPVGFRLPQMFVGWGFDIYGRDITVKPFKGNKVDKLDQDTWKTGPVDIRWDPDNNIWRGHYPEFYAKNLKGQNGSVVNFEGKWSSVKSVINDPIYFKNISAPIHLKRIPSADPKREIEFRADIPPELAGSVGLLANVDENGIPYVDWWWCRVTEKDKNGKDLVPKGGSSSGQGINRFIYQNCPTCAPVPNDWTIPTMASEPLPSSADITSTIALDAVIDNYGTVFNIDISGSLTLSDPGAALTNGGVGSSWSSAATDGSFISGPLTGSFTAGDGFAGGVLNSGAKSGGSCTPNKFAIPINIGPNNKVDIRGDCTTEIQVTSACYITNRTTSGFPDNDFVYIGLTSQSISGAPPIPNRSTNFVVLIGCRKISGIRVGV